VRRWSYGFAYEEVEPQTQFRRLQLRLHLFSRSWNPPKEGLVERFEKYKQVEKHEAAFKRKNENTERKNLDNYTIMHYGVRVPVCLEHLIAQDYEHL
jgi:hypothetical protein